MILNCIGSGILILPSKLAPLGLNAIYAWILTALGALSIGVIFVRLSIGLNTTSIHDIVARPFKSTSTILYQFIRASVFWGYITFSVTGNAMFGIKIVELLSLFIKIPPMLEIFLYVIIFTGIHFINRFNRNVSSMFTLCLVVLKCAIMILLPIISFILYLPSGLHTNWTQIPITSNSIFKGIFRTIWAYFGIESIATDKTAHYKTLRFAMLAGVFICLVTYLLNTVILFTTVPNLATSKSCYANLFAILFGNSSGILTNLMCILLYIGMLQGWTLASIDTLEQGGNLIPRWFLKPNNHKVPELLLGVNGIITVAMILTCMKIFKNTNCAEFLVDIGTSICLVIYMVAILSLVMSNVSKSNKNRESRVRDRVFDLMLCILGLLYCCLALSGASFMINAISLSLIIGFGVINAGI